MSKKTFNLAVGITGGVSAISIAVVTFCDPNFCAAINASIAVAQAAITEILSMFTKEGENA